MNIIYLDLSPDYIPFLVQCTDGTGAKVDAAADALIIYEEGGANSTFDSTTISGSPFDPAKVNSKTGLWGVLVPKSALTAGKWYIALWEMTVDSITTAKVERYFVMNSPSNAPTDAIIAAIAALNNLSAAQVNAEVVDVLRTDTIPDSYSADGAQPTIVQALLAIHQMMQEKSITSTTLTVKKPDGTTPAMTFILNDGTTPTAITRAS